MEYWDIFLVVVAIVGFLATVIPFFSKLNNTLGELNATVKQLRESLNKIDSNNRDTHKEIFEKLDDHEKRISHLE